MPLINPFEVSAEDQESDVAAALKWKSLETRRPVVHIFGRLMTTAHNGRIIERRVIPEALVKRK